MSHEEKLLLKLQGLLFFTLALAGIFLNVFLFQLGGFKIVASYGLVTFISVFICYTLSGYFLRKRSSISLIRLGLLILAINYGLFFILRERSIDFFLLLGGLNGIGAGCFWAGNNLTQYIATHEHTRSEYFGKLNFFINMGSALGPILGGAIIYSFRIATLQNTGYAVLFLLVSLLLTFIFFFVKKLPDHTGVDFSLRHVRAHKRTSVWKIVLTQQFLYGLFDSTFSAFSGVLMFLIVQQEFTLGVVSTFSTIVYGLANILAIKLLKRHKHAYLFGMIFCSLGLLLFGLQQNWLGIASLILITNVFFPLLNITTTKAIYDTIDRNEEPWENKYHFLLERDSCLGFGRILSYAVLLLFFTQANQLAVARTWVLLIPLLPLSIGFLQFYRQKFLTYTLQVE